ncbi:hypothetical protein OEA41_005080 [Lepraria neglecta]|uniref:Uncharacterized protein n=1 Tax=Lepraria neglecta TaxID=209136 RepID=A0AAD9Z1I5_9LECA|nr:hypothetical protein OEA41_005080 [Lepraria neglecta]
MLYYGLRGLWNCDVPYNPSNSDLSTIGTVHDSVTIAFGPSALSTGVCYHSDWRPINYTELYNPSPDYEMATEAACFGTNINTKGLDSSFVLAEQPLFSMPRDLSLVDPLWSGCTPIAGAFDPASVLVRASVLIATSSTRAMPASSLTHQLVSETAANAQSEASPKQQQPPNDKASGADDAGEPLLYEATGGGIIL